MKYFFFLSLLIFPLQLAHANCDMACPIDFTRQYSVEGLNQRQACIDRCKQNEEQQNKMEEQERKIQEQQEQLEDQESRLDDLESQQDD